VSKENKPANAFIFLIGEDQKKISGMMIGESGDLVLYLFDDKVKSINITYVGSGQVKIPIEKVKNRLVDIKVQLYAVASEN
jgi:hypothetical protein